ncbi:MAG: Alpha-galactosidase [Candidatus Hydrogenedentes bacterium ADurb.Bin179]|nr:MAG: Alpha-galactosidase [Candidatus Hydrogenedentes bacterium ADurb.Bin179]
MMILSQFLLFLCISSPGDSWTLETSDTRIVIGVQDNLPVIQQLETPGAAFKWAAGEGYVPLMAQAGVEGQLVDLQWAFGKGGTDTDGVLRLHFTNERPKLALVSVWRARAKHGPIEHWVEITNQGEESVMLTQQESLGLLLNIPGEETEAWWVKRGGSNASTQGGTFHEPLHPGLDLNLLSNCEDGASPVPWLALQTGDAHGLYVGWEFSGLGRVAANAQTDTVRLGAGLCPEFRTDIMPGETFYVPPAFVGCYTGDLDSGSYSLHRWIVEALRPNIPEGTDDPTLAYNLYLDVGGNRATEADVLRSARFCHDIGFETFMPDAMWFPSTGDWRWDPVRFPNGVRPIEEFLHSAGMKLALWCAWTNGGVSEDPGALSVRGAAGHPDWFTGDFAPDWQPAAFSGGQVCLACEEAKSWEIQKTQWLVGFHKLDYLKHDCGPIVNHCNKTTHRHHYDSDVSYWATMGYYEVQEQLRRAFPHLILENCSGGGHIKDFGVIQRTHYTVTTDTLSNLPDRQSLYDSTFALPPILLQAYTYEWEYKVPGDDPEPFLWRSAMMGAWQIDPTRTAKWIPTQKELARRHADIYKQWVRPMLRDVKVHHILPRPDGKHWDGMFYWSQALSRGTLYVFRPDAPENERRIPLKGLARDSKYWLWSEDGSIASGEYRGADLMDEGVAVHLSAPYSSDLIYVRDGALGKPGELVAPGAFSLKEADAQSDYFEASATLAWTPAAGAHGYRVVLSTEADFGTGITEQRVPETNCTLTGLAPGQGYYWKVEAIAYGGKRFNDGDAGVFTTPAAKPLDGIQFLSDGPWISANAGADNQVKRDCNYYNNPIGIAGNTYPKGLWTHAFDDATPADIVMDVSTGQWRWFAADAGVEDAASGSIQFQVLLDDEVVAESPVMRTGQRHRFQVELTGAEKLTLRVLNGGDGYASDHAAWAMARLIAKDATDPF